MNIKVGFIGAGKLGLPCALATESKGHEVFVYDVSPTVKNIIEQKKIPYQEEGAQELLDKSKIKFVSLETILKETDLTFVAVQTPHNPLYEGITRLQRERVDFDYTYLKNAIKDISKTLDKLNKDQIIIIISTVLPMTVETKIKPLMSKHVKLCYNPFFIAMGTTVYDFLHPEIVLFGVDDRFAVDKAKEFYQTITNAPFKEVSIVNAELTKVNYNTFIGQKINFGNNVGFMCYLINQEMKKYGLTPNADADTVIDCLKDCKDRIISSRYMYAGMPDGGGCHPRDNIALSWLAENLGLGSNIYDDQMMTREKHIEFFVSLIKHELNQEWNKEKNIQVAVLGKAYKPETNLTLGSPSILLQNILKENKINCEFYDPIIDGKPSVELFNSAHIYFIGTKHNEFAKYRYPNGSIIIDPFGYIPSSKETKVIHIGRAK